MVWRGMWLLVLLDSMEVRMGSGIVSLLTGKEMYCVRCWGKVKLWWHLVVDMDLLELSHACFGWMSGGDVFRQRESV